MNKTLEAQCQLFIKNRNKMKENFIWERTAIYPLCASLYTEQGKEMEINKIRESKEIIREETGIFSNFKGNIFLVLAAQLALEESPKEKFQKVKKMYAALKQVFWPSEYLPLTAFALAHKVPEDEYNEVAMKVKRIYGKMKEEHPFLTSKEDVSFAALFAISEMDEDEVICEMEKCYGHLKNEFFSANAIQSLSHALAFGEESSEAKCERVVAIFNRLKDNGCKYGTGIELATLGVLALITEDVEGAVRDILEVNRYLLDSHGFGAFGTGKVQRLMYAVLMVTQAYKKENQVMKTAFANSITSIIIAQQVALTAAIATSAAASAASN